jgi:hypothetical protein
MSNTALAKAARTPDDYARLGISRDGIQPSEDGARTDNRRGTYEWWYFDAHLDDGSTLVVVFMNKDLTTPGKPLAPRIRLNLDLADGRSIEKVVDFPAGSWTAAHDHADVRIGENRFRGDLHTYTIDVTLDDLDVHVTLTGTVPPWRPETGYMLFGPDDGLEFAWLPSVPEGKVEGTYTVDGETRHASGVGYHDHNWGNVSLLKVIHDWYWARGHAGPYSVIASYITAHEKYGYSAIPILMIAKDGQIVADDATRVRFETEGLYVDQATGKPVAGVIRYVYEDGDLRYEVTFTREQDLANARMIDTLPRPRRVLARVARFDGAYLRFTGECRVQRFERGVMVEDHADTAIWELMYFGHAR